MTRSLPSPFPSAKALRLILLAAFLGRCAAGVCFRHAGDWDSYFVGIARNLASGQGYSGETPDSFSAPYRALRPPLYPAFLALWIRIFGENRGLIVAHAGLGTLVVWLVYLIGREADREETGLLAAALASVYPFYVFNDTGPSDRMLFTLALAWAVLCAIQVRGARTGAALGLACLIRPTGLFFVPAAAAWFWRFTPRPRRTIAAAVAAFLLTMAPWLARNVGLYGRPVYVSSVGLELWDDHVAVGQECGYPWVSIDRCIDMAMAAIPPEEFSRLKKMGELERDRDLMRQALRFIWEHLGEEPRFAWKKLQGIYSPRFNPQWDIYMKQWRNRPVRWAQSSAYAVILAGACAAFLKLRGRIKLAWLSVYLFLGLTVCTVLFVGHTIHRAPLDFLLMVLASAYAVSWLPLRKGESRQAGR